jgi:hypothetical protein
MIEHDGNYDEVVADVYYDGIMMMMTMMMMMPIFMIYDDNR